MVRPVLPRYLPVVNPSGNVLNTLTTYVFIPLAIMAVFMIANIIMMNCAEDEYELPKKKVLLLFPVFAGLATICACGVSLTAVKGLLLCMILIYASIADIEKHEVPDFLSVMILLIAFIGFDVANLPGMILGATAVFIPQLAIAMLKPNRYGGADIKFSTALAFLLGAEKGIFAIILGLVIAVIAMICIRRAKKLPKDTAFPIVPFIAFGGLVAFLL